MKGVVGTAVFLTLFILSAIAVPSIASADVPMRSLEYIVFGLGLVCLAIAHTTIAYLSPPDARRGELIRGAVKIFFVCWFAVVFRGVEAIFIAAGWSNAEFSAGPLMWLFFGLMYCYVFVDVLRRISVKGTRTE